MEFKKSKFIKFAGICGILLPMIVFAFIGISIYLYSDFSWFENWLSELAGEPGETPIWAARGLYSIIFNAGIILAGIFGLILVSALWNLPLLGSKVGRIGKIFLLVDILALISIGVFPNTTGIYHTVASVLFFFLVPLALIPLGISFRRNRENKIGSSVMLLGIISFFSFPLFLIPEPVGSNALVEMIPSLSIAISAIFFGVYLLKGNYHLKE
jgi:hypothetical membrane protein